MAIISISTSDSLGLIEAYDRPKRQSIGDSLTIAEVLAESSRKEVGDFIVFEDGTCVCKELNRSLLDPLNISEALFIDLPFPPSDAGLSNHHGFTTNIIYNLICSDSLLLRQSYSEVGGVINGDSCCVVGEMVTESGVELLTEGGSDLLL